LRVLKWNRGENDVEVAYALNSLGYIYSNSKCDQYNLVMAVKYQEDALKSLPQNTEEYAKALCNIAVCYFNMLKSEDHDTGVDMTLKAIRHLENCIAVYENISQEPGSSTNNEKMLGFAQSVYYKGVLHMQLSTFRKNSDEDELAIDCFEDSLAIFRELLKIDCSTYASESSNVMQKLGMMWIKRRDYDQAMSYFQSALKVQEEAFKGDFDGDENKDLADIYYGMGVVLCERRDRNYEEAMECYKKCLKIRVLAFGPNHIDVAQTLNNIGSVYARLNKFSDAKDYWTRALEIYRLNKLHDDDEKVKCTLSNMELANKLVILPAKPTRRRSSKKSPPV
jgi:tetratricopeptide (TPR) repeat protein